MIDGTSPQSEAPLVETPGGLVIPADVADQVEGLGPVTDAADGRRRIVLTREDRRALNRAIKILQAAGLGLVVGCRGTCGQPLMREGGDGPDQGYGCRCSRVHFR